jgi:nitroreductase
MTKIAETEHEILDIIKMRWSPRAFSNQQVPPSKLLNLFEAARWSASCFNEQPWRFIVGVKGENATWRKLFDTLSDANQSWCEEVPVLATLCSKKTFSHNNKSNDWHIYDLGQTAAYISLQAVAEGLYVHQMAGFDKKILSSNLDISDDFEPVTMMAIGYIGDPSKLPDKLQKSESASRIRKPLVDILFKGSMS